MKLKSKEKDILQQNKDILLAVFNRRIAELKNLMVIEKDNRDRRADLIIEIGFLMKDLGLIKMPQKEKKENYI